jgi:hypothetical protein
MHNAAEAPRTTAGDELAIMSSNEPTKMQQLVDAISKRFLKEDQKFANVKDILEAPITALKKVDQKTAKLLEEAAFISRIVDRREPPVRSTALLESIFVASIANVRLGKRTNVLPPPERITFPPLLLITSRIASRPSTFDTMRDAPMLSFNLLDEKMKSWIPVMSYNTSTSFFVISCIPGPLRLSSACKFRK